MGSAAGQTIPLLAEGTKKNSSRRAHETYKKVVSCVREGRGAFSGFGDTRRIQMVVGGRKRTNVTYFLRTLTKLVKGLLSA